MIHSVRKNGFKRHILKLCTVKSLRGVSASVFCTQTMQPFFVSRFGNSRSETQRMALRKVGTFPVPPLASTTNSKQTLKSTSSLQVENGGSTQFPPPLPQSCHHHRRRRKGTKKKEKSAKGTSVLSVHVCNHAAGPRL